MKRLTENKIVLVIRETRVDELIAQFNTLPQARFYVERLGGDFDDLQAEAQVYAAAIRQAEAALGRLGRVQKIHRKYLPSFIFGDDDIVVVLGQDGLVANTLKYLNQQPVVGVNPDFARYDGILLPFSTGDLSKIIPEIMAGRRPGRSISMAQTRLSDGQTLSAVNDFFIGARSHVSARYRISLGKQSERHSSSGIIVSTGLGATGWLQSILAGARGIISALDAGNHTSVELKEKFAWDADHLYFSVREPFPSNVTSTNMVFGKITRKIPLVLRSEMAANGVIFSDGMEQDFLKFNSGMEATISVAPKKGLLVI